MQLTAQTLNSIKLRIEKLSNNFSFKKDLLTDFKEMEGCILDLTKENNILKERLFDLEQALPSEQQWQNIISAKLEVAGLNNNDFLEITSSFNGQSYFITVQKKFGKTPKQLLDVATSQKLKVLKKNIALKNHIIGLQDSITYINIENRALKYLMIPIKFNFESNVEFSRKMIELAIYNTKELVRKFNNHFLVYHEDKLHDSFKAALKEATYRFQFAERRFQVLAKENKLLKAAILQKKYSYCKIYKGKLKK